MYTEDELFGDPVQPVNEPEDNHQEDIDQNDQDDFIQQYHYNQDDDEDDIFEQHGDDPDNGNKDSDSEQTEDFMSKYLKSKKVDKSKIRIFNEDTQEEEEVNFDELTDDEKIELLESINQPILTDSELDMINFMRQHKTDLNGYANAIRQQVIQELGEKPVSELKDISDDDLFRFDLIDRYGFDKDTDAEEIEAILEKEKENENLFNRKVAALRKEYEELEENQRREAEESAKEEEQRDWEELKDNLIQVAQNVDLLHGLELDNNDKNEVLSFILDKDEVTGDSEFIKCYKDPDMLFKMAWYALKGDEAFRTIEDYYKGKLAEARRENKEQTPVVTRKQTIKR